MFDLNLNKVCRFDAQKSPKISSPNDWRSNIWRNFWHWLSLPLDWAAALSITMAIITTMATRSLTRMVAHRDKQKKGIADCERFRRIAYVEPIHLSFCISFAIRPRIPVSLLCAEGQVLSKRLTLYSRTLQLLQGVTRNKEQVKGTHQGCSWQGSGKVRWIDW